MIKQTILVILIVSCFSFNIHKNDETTVIIDTNTQSVNAINWPFTVCGTGSWTIQKLTLGSTPKRNTTDDIDVIGTANDATSFKSVNINVKLNGVPLHTESVDFVKNYDNGDTVQFTYKNYVPDFAPSGTYGLTFTFVNNAGKDNGCLAFTFKL